jgi:hypothetical protein
MWNYRIIKTKDSYGLHEVMYNDNQEITGYVENPEIIGENPEEILQTLRLMLDDVNKSYYNILEAEKIKFAPMYDEKDLSEAITFEEFSKMLDKLDQ